MKSLQLFLLLLVAAQGSASAETQWRVEGLEMPESAVVDTARQRIIVSNIKGSPGAADGNGYLSLLSLDGELLEQHWAEGMDAPKGMAVVGGQLLVADLRQLHLVDMQSGELVQSVAVADAVFLNDISSDGTVAYISDMMNHTLYRYEDGAVSTWLKTDALLHPNGVLMDGDRLLVATWGSPLHEDFSTDQPGGVFAVDRATQAITPLEGAQALGNLDGLVHTPEGFAVNDWITGQLWMLDAEGRVISSETTQPGLADISTGAELLLMPYMLDGVLEARSIAQ